MQTNDQIDVLDALGTTGFAAIIMAFPEAGVTVFDHDLRVLRAGGLILAELGLAPVVIEGRTIVEVFPPEMTALVEASYRQALCGHSRSIDVPYAARIYHQRTAPLTDREGHVVAGMGFLQDVTAARHAAQTLSESEQQFRMAFENAPICKALVGLDGRYLRVNPAMCALTGYTAAQLRELTGFDLTHPDDVADNVAGTNKLLAGELATYVTEKRFITASGKVVWVAMSLSLVRGEGGLPLNFISQFQDISERKYEEQLLAKEHRRLRAAQTIGHIGSWEMDVATRAVIWSDTLFDLYGLDPAAFPGDKESALRGIHPDDADRVRADLDACAVDGTPMRNRHRVYRYNDGELRWFDTRAERHQDDDLIVAGVVSDVTEQVLAEARLAHAALHDALTALPNRRLVTDRLARTLDRSEREGQIVALFCDLDGFKRVNDIHGHHTGDTVLIETAKRLVAATRSGDTVGRMGGDEFVVICGVPRGQNPSALAELVVGRIERSIAEPMVVDGLEHRLTVSVGICLANQGDNADLVLRHADVAMDQAKAQGKDGHATFDALLESAVLDRESIERQIHQAMADDTLEVYYQPIVDPKDGCVRSVEALLRVPDGAGRYLDTYQAVVIAEQAGIITTIGERVLTLACAQVAGWRQQPGHAELKLSVNRSAAEIARPGLYDRITAIVTDSRLDPGALTIEITESVLLEAAPHTIADLERLRADGIGIAIDDFGTGYASLHYLATLPISCLKVDSSFTAGLPDDPTCATIIAATVGLAADLDMSCVVEGVETVEQLNALPASPQLLVQGYLYARPQPPWDELPTHLAPH